MGKRQYGSGGLVKLADNHWRLRVSAGTDPITGRRRVVTETLHSTKRDAQQRLAELVAQHSGRPGTESTLRRIIDTWLGDANHARGTRRNYDLARSRIPAAMLDTPARRITPYDLQRLYRSVTDKHGPNPTHCLHALISGAYTNARRLRWVNDHPARDLLLPALPKRAKTTPLAGSVLKILAAADDQQQALWLRLVTVTGRRRSEVIAIRWSNIDLDGSVLRVEHALDIDGSVKATKTEDQAEIAVDTVTVKMIRSWQLAQRERALAVGVPLAADPWLFSDDPSSTIPWRPDLATRRFSATRKRAGVPATIRLQDMRHANVTFLIANGTDPRTVAGRVGHDPAMSLGRYSAIVNSANRAAAELIAAAIDTPAASL